MGRRPKNADGVAAKAAKNKVNMIIDPTGEMIDCTKLALCKAHLDCFSCVEGYCTAVQAKYIGGTCPFYKNRDQCVAENRLAYERLKEHGRYDILDQYGETLAALGALDTEMETMDQMAKEMEAFRERDLKIREADATSGGQ